MRIHLPRTACVLLLLAGSALAQSTRESKKLIEFGWDEPDTALMRKHIAAMEKTPFDGCVYHPYYTKPDGTKGDFMWECWGSRGFTEAEMAASLADLQATKFNRFTHNFLRFNTAPGNVDWFDDFSAVVNNVRLAARLAREGRSRGILFDTEQYDRQLFEYGKQRDAATKSWDQYATQARQRGREIMTAMQAEFPDLTVFLTFGHTLPFRQAGGDKAKLPQANYGLLAPFLDGMLDAATGKTVIVDGYELSYGYKEPAEFDEAYETMRTGVLPFVADPAKYGRVMSFGFGIWLDNKWRKQGWNIEDFRTNYFTPGEFERSVREALRRTDEYVWIYSETPRWWSEDGTAKKLPKEYDAALRRAAGRE